MNTKYFYALILFILSSSTYAADLSSIKSTEAADNKSIWQGFYLGLNGGIGSLEGSANQIDSSYSPEITIFSVAANSSLGSKKTFANGGSGPNFGGQIGYNFLFTKHILLGFETDFNYSNVAFISKNRGDFVIHYSLPSFGGVNSSKGSISLDWFGTTRARIGYSIGKILPYLTGGLTYGNLNSLSSENSVGSNPPILSLSTSNASVNKILAGWTIGAGAEYFIFDNISLRSEFNFLQFEGYNFTKTSYSYYGGSGINGFGFNYSSGNTSKLNYYQTKVGINYFPRLINSPLSATINNVSENFTDNNDWGGVYAGINASYASGNTNDIQTVNNIIGKVDAVGSAHTNSYGSNGGALAGIQIGYNKHLLSSYIIGAEADFEWSGLQNASNITDLNYIIGSPMSVSKTSSNFRDRLEWYGTARGRLGYSYGHILPYITAGLAYGLTTTSETSLSSTFASSSPQHAFLRTGGTIGAGLDVFLFNNISAKIEYLYTDFGMIHQKYNEYTYITGFPQNSFRDRWRDLDFHQVRVGFNYHFNANEEKVVAKY